MFINLNVCKVHDYQSINVLMKKGVLFVKSNKYIVYCCLCAAIAIGSSC